MDDLLEGLIDIVTDLDGPWQVVVGIIIVAIIIGLAWYFFFKGEPETATTLLNQIMIYV